MDGLPVALSQETQYPWDGTVKITIKQCPPSELSLELRIPGWANGGTLQGLVDGRGEPGLQLRRARHGSVDVR